MSFPDLDIVLNSKENFGDTVLNKFSYLFLLFVKNMFDRSARHFGSWTLIAACLPQTSLSRNLQCPHDDTQCNSSLLTPAQVPRN